MDQVQIDNLMASKMAVEQMYNKLQIELHEAKTIIILKDAQIGNLVKELNDAKETQMHVIALESKEGTPKKVKEK